VLEDDDDETVVVSNVSKGYDDEDEFGIQDMPPTTQCQKPAQITKTFTPVFSQIVDGQNVHGIASFNGRTSKNSQMQALFQHYAAKTRSGVRHIRLRSRGTFSSGRSPIG